MHLPGQPVILACLVTALSHAPRAHAQSAGAVELFGAVNNSFSIPQMVGGLGLSAGTDMIGVRGSIGSSFGAAGSSRFGSPSAHSDMWAADADIVIGATSARSRGFAPYAFAGVGAQSGLRSPGLADAINTWSYGGGLLIPFASSLSLRAEGRYRALLGAPRNDGAPSGFARGQEYRAGLVLGFGRSRGRLSPPRRDTGRGAGIPSSRSRTPRGAPAGASRRVVAAGEEYLGVPYVYGGSTPRGFDCSGFVQYVYREQGVNLPRTSRQMAGAGVAVSPHQRYLVEGDLMLFAQNGEINHVAIYAGDGRFIHSSSSGGGVRYDDLGTKRGRWFADHMVAARRVADDGRGFLNAFLARANIPFDHFDVPDAAPPVAVRRR